MIDALGKLIDKFPVVSAAVPILAIFYAAAGFHAYLTEKVSFQDYGTSLLGFAVALGLVGGARAYIAGKKVEAESGKTETTVTTTSPEGAPPAQVEVSSAQAVAVRKRTPAKKKPAPRRPR